jgi:hypothetical protein
MAKVLNVYPKDVYATIEFSMDQLKKIRTFMDKSHMDFRRDVAEEAGAARYVQEEFYPMLADVIDSFESGGTQ